MTTTPAPMCEEHHVLLNPSGFCPKCDARTLRRLPKPRVTFDDRTYTVRSRKTEIPDFAAMDRTAVLIWLNQNTYATGRGSRTKPNPLAGMGDAIRVTVR
jgi:hypothetical protein